MKVTSFFAGAGGFDLGFINAGFDIVQAFEWDKYAVQSYRENIGDHIQEVDVATLKGEHLERSNVWLFGFPCQDVSHAGRKAGMEQGTRTGLFYEIMRLLGEVKQQPEIILAENVKGLKKYLPTVEEEYEKVGYRFYMTEYNSKYFGVAQSRERYFLVGVRNDLVGDFEFPEQQTEFVPSLKDFLIPNPDPKYYMSETAIRWLQAHREKHIKKGTGFRWDLRDLDGVASTLRATPKFCPTDNSVLQEVDEKYYIQDEKALQIIENAKIRITSLGDVHALSTPSRATKVQNGRRMKDDGEVMFTLTTNDVHGILEKQPEINVIGRAEGIKGHDLIRRIYSINGLSPTLNTAGGGNQQPKVLVEVPINRYRVRRLTPREFARLQAFPDSYRQIVSDTQFYKQMGNAVTVTVAYVIAESIKEFLHEKK